MVSNIIHGQTRNRISMGQLSLLEIPVPPPHIENNFCQCVQNFEYIQIYQKKSKQHIDDLFSALMQQAFRGELTT